MDNLNKYYLVAQKGLQPNNNPLNEPKVHDYGDTIAIIMDLLESVSRSYDNCKLAHFVCVSALDVIERGLKNPEYFETSKMVGADEYDILRYAPKSKALGFLNDDNTMKHVSEAMDFRVNERNKIFKSKDFRISSINVFADIVAQECYHSIRNTLGDKGLESRNHQLLPYSGYRFD